MENKITSRIVFLFLMFGYSLSLSQSLHFKHFTTLDGLPSQTVYEAFQDTKGFMWFATSAGISRFDGNRFTNYTLEDGLPDNEIFGFYEDVFGRIWLRSMNGKIGYVQNNKIYTSQNTPELKSLDKHSSTIWKITGTQDSSILIAYWRHGVIEYSSKNKAIPFRLYENKGINYGALGAYQNPNGSYTVIGGSNHLFQVNSNKVVTKIKTIPISSAQVNQFINGTYYFGSSNTLMKINEGHQISPWVTIDNNVLNICKGKGNSIWVCTQKGAIPFNSKGEALKKKYLNDNAIASVFEDNENNIWFTTLDNGIFLTTNENLKNYTAKEGLSSDKIFSINKDDLGNIWIGHDNFTLTKIDKTGKVSLKKNFRVYT